MRPPADRRGCSTTSSLRYAEQMARDPAPFNEILVPFDAQFQPLPSDVVLAPSAFFPPPTATTAEGLLCVGGCLTPEWLLDAYSHGIFPWPMWSDEPIAWWSPDPRAIFELDALHVSRRLRRRLKTREFHATCDQAFDGVIRACASVGDRLDNTWLTPPMIQAYCRMHELGYAHSVEVWHEGELVGGTYGVAIGGLFAAESMFHTRPDASKVALVHLAAHLRAREYRLWDIQQLTPHTASLGAVEIPRVDYLRRLTAATPLDVTFGARLSGAV